MNIACPYVVPEPQLAYGMSTEMRRGDISASSTTFTITSAPYVDGRLHRFSVGDHVIVELGGEAGAGMRGTVGVGGSYAGNGDPNDYYAGGVVPWALMTTVTAVSGSVLTLADAATVASTGANIYFDNSYILQALILTAPSLIDLPAGRFAMSRGITNEAGAALTGAIIKGQGKTATTLFAPKGAGGCGMLIFGGACTIHDFGLVGNFLLNGYNNIDVGTHGITPGLHILGDLNTVYNIYVQDMWLKAVWFGGNTNTATDCDYVATNQVRKYYSPWFFGANDTTDCTFTRCNVTSSHTIWGYETFRSQRIKFIDCTSVNGTFSSNSSGDWELNNFNLTVTPQISLPLFNGIGGFSPTGYLIDVNDNIGGGFVGDGGTVNDLTVNVNGNTYAAADIPEFAPVQPRCMAIAPTCQDILVDTGTITYVVAGWACGVNSDGATNTVVQNVTVNGTIDPLGTLSESPNFNITVDDGAVTNCTAAKINCVGPDCVLT